MINLNFYFDLINQNKNLKNKSIIIWIKIFISC